MGSDEVLFSSLSSSWSLMKIWNPMDQSWARWECPGASLKGAGLTLLPAGLWVCCIMCSVLWYRVWGPLEVGLWWAMTSHLLSLTWMPGRCGFPRVGGPAVGLVGTAAGWVFIASDWRICHTSKRTSSLPPQFGVRVCASLAADKPRATAFTLKFLDIPAMDVCSSSLIHHFPHVLSLSLRQFNLKLRASA